MRHTMTQEYVDACILGLTVETTGERGGDAGHGGETIVRLEDASSTCMLVSFMGQTKWSRRDAEPQEVRMVELRVCGDAELRTLTRALEDAAHFLRSVIK